MLYKMNNWFKIWFIQIFSNDFSVFLLIQLKVNYCINFLINVSIDWKYITNNYKIFDRNGCKCRPKGPLSNDLSIDSFA